MGVFIRVEIEKEKCLGAEQCGDCVKACSVSVFSKQENEILTGEDQEDECILCDLCLKACPPQCIAIRKLYDDRI
jgi:NAD-dependent dihydropyrimidine dehydrogenase PreA subunit